MSNGEFSTTFVAGRGGNLGCELCPRRVYPLRALPSDAAVLLSPNPERLAQAGITRACLSSFTRHDIGYVWGTGYLGPALESGSRPAERDARESQLLHMSRSHEVEEQGQLCVLVGDLNLRVGEERDLQNKQTPRTDTRV